MRRLRSRIMPSRRRRCRPRTSWRMGTCCRPPCRSVAWSPCSPLTPGATSGQTLRPFSRTVAEDWSAVCALRFARTCADEAHACGAWVGGMMTTPQRRAFFGDDGDGVRGVHGAARGDRVRAVRTRVHVPRVFTAPQALPAVPYARHAKAETLRLGRLSVWGGMYIHSSKWSLSPD
jgi:hypothetical protein